MKAVFLLGPTASGKSAVALALAGRFGAEIVSVDSAQVYRGMDIGTAKPTRAERDRIPHHLIDLVSPMEAYSAGRFRDDALVAVRAIGARGRLPLLVGGTMLYYRALTRGLADLPVAQPALREEIEERAQREGWPALHAELARVDPESAARIEPGDAQRIQRALEVHRHTGRPLSQLQAAGLQESAMGGALSISLEPSDRAVLHERIAARFRAMLGRGLVAELEGLRALYPLHASLPAMRTVGYRQAWDTLEGTQPAATLEARGVAGTRQLAKRQLTWLRAMPEVERIDSLAADVEARVALRVERYLDA